MANFTDNAKNSDESTTTTFDEGFVVSRNLVGVVFYALALTLGMFGSVFGNALTLIAISKHRALHNKTSCFIASLAVADMLNGGLTFPLMLASTIFGRWPFSNGLCVFLGSLTITFCAASVNTLTFVSIDRYFAIVDPLRYMTKVTSTFVTICITYSWVEAIWLAMMPIAGWSHYEYIPSEYLCTVYWATYSYTTFLLLYNLGVPVVIVIFCYARIFKVARDQSRKVAEQTVQIGGAGKPASKTETKAAKILFVVIGTFLMCWIPHSVTMFCNAFSHHECPIHESYHTITVLLAMTNSAMNPILYGIMNRQMRCAYFNILCYFRRGSGADFSLNEYSI